MGVKLVRKIGEFGRQTGLWGAGKFAQISNKGVCAVVDQVNIKAESKILFPRRDFNRLRKNVPLLQSVFDAVEDTPEKQAKRERVLNPKTKADKAEFSRPKLFYFICMVPRSGSTWLSQILRSTRLMGLPHEHLNFRSRVTLLDLVDEYGVKDRRTYLELLCRLHKTPNGVFGMKMDFDQIAPFIIDGLLEDVFPEARYIYQTRENIMMQALSRFSRPIREGRAAQRLAIADDDNMHELVMDRAATLIDTMASWEYFFAARGILPHRMPYERLVQDRDGEIERFTKFIGLDLPEGFALTKAKDAAGVNMRTSDTARQVVETVTGGKGYRINWDDAVAAFAKS